VKYQQAGSEIKQLKEGFQEIAGRNKNSNPLQNILTTRRDKNSVT
jgi:hypothetical protein